MDIFTSEFLSADTDAVHQAIVDDGFWICDRGLDADFAAALDEDLGGKPLALNVNDVGPVRFNHQTYFTHALAGSKEFFALATHPKLRALCRAHLGERFRLKCQRYYQSARHHELIWHTDDKTPMGQRTNVAGVGVVMYLRDTFEGELQVLRGSNRWSETMGKKHELEDREVAARHANDVVTISRKAGAVIIFDSKTFHRTRPITKRDFVRKSVFLQVDADLNHSEKMIVDTQYLDLSDPELLQYLGCGLPSGYPSMPPSSISTLTAADLRKLLRQSAGQLTFRAVKFPARLLLGALRSLRT